MTVSDVLAEIGWPLGTRGRTTCPIHRGDNDQAFSYRDEVWNCFACGEAGNAHQLHDRFRPPLEGVRLSRHQIGHWLRPGGPVVRPPHLRMEDGLRKARRSLQETHARASRDLRRGRALLARTRAPEEPLWQVAAWLIVEALGEIDRLDAQLGDCGCREEEVLSSLSRRPSVPQTRECET